MRSDRQFETVGIKTLSYIHRDFPLSTSRPVRCDFDSAEDIMLQLLQRHLVRNASLVGAAILFGASSVSYADTTSTTPNVSPNDSEITAASEPTNRLVSKFTSFA